MSRKLGAEFIGTFTLVSSVCGAALFSAPSAGLMTIAFAIGAAVLRDGLCRGPHLRRTFQSRSDLWPRRGRTHFEIGEAIPYIVVQVIGGAAAATIFYIILSGAPAGKWNNSFAISNIYGGDGHFVDYVGGADRSGANRTVSHGHRRHDLEESASRLRSDRHRANLSTFIHLAAIPVSNASVNPARSTATAIFGGGAALSSLWLFWVAPIVRRHPEPPK